MQHNRKLKRQTVVTIWMAAALFLLYLLIFGFSSQTGEESGGLSRYLSEKCAEVLNALSGKHWTQYALESMAAYFEHPLRKLAHFSEYALMGVLVYTLWRQWMERGKRLFLLVPLWVFASASADEFHQLFVAGRYGSFADVLLDTCGGVFGMLVCIWVEKKYNKKSMI